MPQIDKKVLDGMLKSGLLKKEAYDKLLAEQNSSVIGATEAPSKPEKPSVPAGSAETAVTEQKPVEQPDVQSAEEQQVSEKAALTPPDVTESPKVADATLAAKKQMMSEMAKNEAKIAALQDMAAAAGAVGYAEGVAEAHARYIAKQAAIEREKEELTFEFENRYQNVLGELKSQSIDAFRIFKKMDTKDKVLLAISSALAGLSGGSNQVMAMINQAIDADIRAQMAEANKLLDVAKAEESAYTKMLKAFDDKMAAALAVKNASLEIIQAKLDETMLPLKNERQKLEIQQLKHNIAKLQLEIQQQLMATMQSNPQVERRLNTVEKIASINDKDVKNVALKEYDVEKQFVTTTRQIDEEFRKVSEKVQGLGRVTAGDDIEVLRVKMINAYEAVTGDSIKQNEKAIDSILGGFLPSRFDRQEKINEKRKAFLSFLAEQRNNRVKTLIDLGIVSEIKPVNAFTKVK